MKGEDLSEGLSLQAYTLQCYVMKTAHWTEVIRTQIVL